MCCTVTTWLLLYVHITKNTWHVQIMNITGRLFACYPTYLIETWISKQQKHLRYRGKRKRRHKNISNAKRMHGVIANEPLFSLQIVLVILFEFFTCFISQSSRLLLRLIILCIYISFQAKQRFGDITVSMPLSSLF